VRWAIILAGGVGSRFWPVSTATRPKQLLPLASDAPLLIETVERLAPLIPPERVFVVTSQALAPALGDALPGLPHNHLLAEPRAAATLPALAWATARIAARDPSASVLSLHADWVIADEPAFRAAATAALEVAERMDLVVTVGARATRPETGFGYVVPGHAIGAGGHAIVRFVEKPDAARAAQLLGQGALWNTGLFAWTAQRFRAEVDAHAIEMHAALPALDANDIAGFYETVTPISIDVGLFERTRRGAVVPGDFGWDDVGSWAALLRVRHADASGNVAVGDDVHVLDATGCVVWSEEGTVIVDGLADAVVVQARGITLVTTAARAPDLKKLLDRLPPALVGERGVGGA
jgi:mannose-1-phosphate guanylyltransferase